MGILGYSGTLPFQDPALTPKCWFHRWQGFGGRRGGRGRRGEVWGTWRRRGTNAALATEEAAATLVTAAAEAAATKAAKMAEEEGRDCRL